MKIITGFVLFLTLTFTGQASSGSLYTQHNHRSSSLKGNRRSEHFRRPLQVVLAGPPASGKGTQAAKLVEEFGLVHLSTGDMLRDAIARNTKLGLEAKYYMDRGDLVPDELVIDLVKERLQQSDCIQNGWILDGFPRTVGQAKALKDSGVEVDVVLNLQVPHTAIVRRIAGRRIDPVTNKVYNLEFNKPSSPEVYERLIHRLDDTKEIILDRLETFHDNLNSIRSQFTLDNNKWIVIHAEEGSPDEIYQKLRKELIEHCSSNVIVADRRSRVATELY